VFSFSVATLHFASVPYCKWSFADITVRPFFNAFITTRQDGGLRNHLLVDAVLQASQVQAGISRNKLRVMLAKMGTSQIDSVSETGVEYGSSQTGQTVRRPGLQERRTSSTRLDIKNMI
jgi:hypothetical protein